MKNAVLALTGDVMLGRGVAWGMQGKPADWCWGDTLSTLQAADAAIINLECVIASGGEPWRRWEKAFHFRADPSAIYALEQAGIDCVTLANNHVLDYESAALLEMLDSLRAHHIAFTGAGKNAEEAACPAIVEAAGRKIGVIACTDNEPGWAATERTPGTNWIPIRMEQEESIEPVRRAIRKAQWLGAETILVSMHWGPNMVERPPDLFRQFAHTVMDLGADVLAGHSAHLFQGIELWGGKPILYDMGDFLDDYEVDDRLRNDWGFLFRLHLEDSRVTRVELMPTIIHRCQVHFAPGETGLAIRDRMIGLCREMGTRAASEGSGLCIDCRQ